MPDTEVVSMCLCWSFHWDAAMDCTSRTCGAGAAGGGMAVSIEFLGSPRHYWPWDSKLVGRVGFDRASLFVCVLLRVKPFLHASYASVMITLCTARDSDFASGGSRKWRSSPRAGPVQSRSACWFWRAEPGAPHRLVMTCCFWKLRLSSSSVERWLAGNCHTLEGVFQLIVVRALRANLFRVTMGTIFEPARAVMANLTEWQTPPEVWFSARGSKRIPLRTCFIFSPKGGARYEWCADQPGNFLIHLQKKQPTQVWDIWDLKMKRSTTPKR